MLNSNKSVKALPLFRVHCVHMLCLHVCYEVIGHMEFLHCTIMRCSLVLLVPVIGAGSVPFYRSGLGSVCHKTRVDPSSLIISFDHVMWCKYCRKKVVFWGRRRVNCEVQEKCIVALFDRVCVGVLSLFLFGSNYPQIYPQTSSATSSFKLKELPYFSSCLFQTNQKHETHHFPCGGGEIVPHNSDSKRFHEL